MAGRFLVDLSPLRESPDFRRLYAGQLVSFFGSQLTVVAVPYQVFLLTDSSLAVGLVSLVQIGPLILGSLIGGSMADSRDRRRLIIVMHVALAAASVGLALNSHRGAPLVWPVFVLTAAAAGFSGVDRPARSAIIPGLVRRDQLPAAYALWQTLMQVGRAVGPAVAGVLIAQFGLAAVYWLDAATFAVALVLVLPMPAQVPEGGGTPAGLGSIVEGLRFLRSHRVIQGGFAVDLNAMVFGMPQALFPALGTGLYGGDATTVGLLFAAPGTGALVGAVTSGWVTHVRQQGLAVLVAVALWGAAIVGFGATSWLPLGLLLLGIAGWADVISAVFRNTILQLSVPDSLRGRLSAVHIAVVTGGPRLGDAEAGAVAALTTPRISVISGGLACLAGVLVTARLFREFAGYRSVVEGEDETQLLLKTGDEGDEDLR